MSHLPSRVSLSGRSTGNDRKGRWLHNPMGRRRSNGSSVNENYEGRLELTWTNKQLNLLAHEDGSYEWMPQSDYRVAEVRLLHDVDVCGTATSLRAKDNLLIRGDALHALNALSSLPEFASEYAGQVQAVYIDPPFNTGQAFKNYDDALEHSVWLTMMRDRLKQVRDLLTPTGTVWVHLDDEEMHRCRLVLDELFGTDCFVGCVIWEKSDSPRMDAQWFSTRHDYLLVYGRTPNARIRGLPYDAEHYKKVDEVGRAYYLKPLRAMGGQGSTREARPTLYFPLHAPDGSEVWPKLPDGRDGAWRWSPDRVTERADLIEWVDGERGWVPYFRIYKKEDARKPPETIWLSGEVGSNRTSKAEIKKLFPEAPPFDTPKPEALLERIIEVTTEPGDIVLDCFLGSGTTAAVAHKMERRWIGIERSESNVATYARPRLEKVVRGEDPGGITSSQGWQGGGGFRLLEVAPSMFAASDGMVFLAEWATNTALAETTAAQLGYDFEPDAPFCGRKGRTRLAVIDGLVNVDVARLLVDRLLDKERLLVCGTAVEDEAFTFLRDSAKGSIRKIPAAILRYYERPSPLRSLIGVTSTDDAEQTIPEPEAVA